jgi:hypothetical protein
VAAAAVTMSMLQTATLAAMMSIIMAVVATIAIKALSI